MGWTICRELTSNKRDIDEVEMEHGSAGVLCMERGLTPQMFINKMNVNALEWQPFSNIIPISN